MKWFYMTMILFQLAVLFRARKIIKYLAVPVSLASVGYLYVTLTYIHSLMEKGCDCTSGQHRTILFWIAMLQALLLMVSIFIGAKK